MEGKELLKGYIFVVLSALLFGLMPLIAKNIYKDGVDPESLVFLKNLISVPCLFILALLSGKPIRIKADAIPQMFFMALMGCCITPLLLFISYKYIPSGTATVFHFIFPAAVVLGEFVFLKNKISIWQLLSVGICIIGIAMFYNPGNSINFKGSACALLSGIAYAVYIICLSGFKYKELSGITFSLYVAVFSSVIMVFAFLFLKGLTFPVSFTGWLLVLLLSTVLNVGAVVMFQKGTLIIGGTRSSVLSAFEPVTSIMAGALVFGERITFFSLLGSVLVIAAGVLIAVNDSKKIQ